MNSGRDLVSSVEAVYQRTRHEILTGDLAPGSPLKLQDLAGRNGVSMIPVREALRLLEAEGFVETIQNRGARVAPISLDDMLDVYRVRIVLECEALRQAIPHISPEMIARARRLNAKLVHQFVHRGHAVYEEHRAFHLMLYEPSGSKWLMRIIAVVWDHTERYRRQGAKMVTPLETGSEHEQILARIEAGDCPGAVAALEAHLSGSMQRMSSLFTPPADDAKAVPTDALALPVAAV